MSWLYLYGAIALEVAGTTSLKLSDGFRNVPAMLAGYGFYAASLSLLTLSLTTIPVGVAYAIWSGVGIVCIALIGFAWFAEPLNPVSLLFIAMIIVGAAGLNLMGVRH